MRTWVRLVSFLSLGFAVGCSATASDSATTGDFTRTVCGPGSAAQVDGSCVAVGPGAPEDAVANAFVRSASGWGYDAVVGDGCSETERAVLGRTDCVAIDDGAAAFPPAGADVIVSTTMSGSNVVATLGAALARVPAGGIIAIDSGTYSSVSITKDVTLVGHGAGDTTVGDGQHNAIFVNGAHVIVSGVTLFSSSSPVAVQRGVVDADRVRVRGADVALAAVGISSSVTVKRSLILGKKSSSLGGMASQGGHIIIDDSELRGLTNGLLATDPNSAITIRRSVVQILASSKSHGFEASAKGRLDAENVLVRAVSGQLAAVHADPGTTGTGSPSPGAMSIRGSVLEQVGAELQDVPAIILNDGGQLDLVDSTIRHQSSIGFLIGDGRSSIVRTAILGEQATATLRAAIAVEVGSADIEGLAVPWAQGIGLMVDHLATVDLRGSLIANVVQRDSAQEAILLSGARFTMSTTEISGSEAQAIVAIGGATVSIGQSLIHDTVPAVGPRSAAALVLHSSVTFDQCLFARNGEGIIAAGSAVVVTGSSFRSHSVAMRAMDGMTIREGAREAADNTLAFDGCRFVDNAEQTSTTTLPDLNAPPFPK